MSDIDAAGGLADAIRSSISLGAFRDARSLAVRLRERLTGLRSLGGPDLFDALLVLGRLAAIEGDFATATRDVEDATTTLQAAGKAAGSWPAARLAEGQAYLAKAMGRDSEAERQYLSVLILLERTEGDGAATMRVIALSNLGDLDRRRGFALSAIARFEEALGATGDDAVIRSAVLYNLANSFSDLRRHDDAIRLHESALRLREEVAAPGLVAESLTALGDALTKSGRYPDAEDRYIQAIGQWRELPTRESELANALMNRGTLYRETMEYGRANTDYLEARTLLEAIGPTARRQLAIVIDNAGGASLLDGDADRAASQFDEAAAMFAELENEARNAGADQGELTRLNRDIDTSRQNLAQLYVEQERLDEAEELGRAALESVAKPSGDPERRAAWLSIMGGICYARGKYSRAFALQRKALSISPDLNPVFLSQLHENLASALAAAGQHKKAFVEAEKAERIRDQFLDATFAGQVEYDRLRTLQLINSDFHAFITLALANASEPAVVASAFSGVLRRKAIGVEASAAARRTQGGSKDSARLDLIQAAIGMAALGASVESDVDALRVERDALEERLARSSSQVSFTARLRTITPGQLADALHAETFFVEFLWFAPTIFTARPWSKQKSEPARYLAFTIDGAHADSLRLLDLGDATEIDNAVAAWRGEITGVQEATAGTPPEAAAATLTARLIEPLGVPREAKALVLALDGSLARLPFAALPIGEQRVLGDDRRVTVVDSGRDVLAWGRNTSAEAGPNYVAGGIDYDAGPTAGQPSQGYVVRLPFGILPWKQLEETEGEARAVAASYGVEPKTGIEPRKGVIKQLRSPRVLHLATHGFFFPEDWTTGIRDPLLRSGLALVGCNRALQGKTLLPGVENGVLTAYDVLGLDLEATRLVVLSACETGLGLVVPNEGIFGLRRAFTIAGARAVVLSLWDVEDAPTSMLMTVMTRSLVKGSTAADALADAQTKVRTRYPERPVAWAAFVLAGDPNTTVGTS